jgi:hypothetical protein
MSGELFTVELVQVKEIDPFERSRVIADLVGPCYRPGSVLCVVEGQYLDHGKGFASAASVVRNAACWQTVAAVRGYVVADTVAPSSWHASYGLAKRGVPRKWRAEQTAEIVRKRFGDLFGSSRTSHILNASPDVQCAVLIGAHMGSKLNPEAFDWVCSERDSRMKNGGPVRVRQNRRKK